MEACPDPLSLRSTVIERLNAALEGRYVVERLLGGTGCGS